MKLTLENVIFQLSECHSALHKLLMKLTPKSANFISLIAGY